MRDKKPILLVEDDRIDAMTVRRAFKEIKVDNELIVASNGEEALKVLQDEDQQKPCIIISDLNMPKMNGIELLTVLKKDETLRKIPVVVLTTSHEVHDRFHCFNLSAAGYLIKPMDYVQFVEVIRTLDLYWTLSELPE
ncbi:MAG: response regulator [bacterium]